MDSEERRKEEFKTSQNEMIDYYSQKIHTTFMFMHFLLQINWIKIILFVGSEERRKKKNLEADRNSNKFDFVDLCNHFCYK